MFKEKLPVEVPARVQPALGRPAWGSDLVVDMLHLLGIEYAAVLPGSSFRGIHDSAVNYAANRGPELILCNHEMITVSLSRGYARAAGRPMAAIVHNVVGLLNTTMTIYDAWCDRVPVLILGGTGPMDASRRRPWIDWIHTANVQGNMVRDFVKWDDQPASIAAIPESLMRAYRIAVTEPAGPVYVCFDIELQERELPDSFSLPDVKRYRPSAPPEPDRGALREAAGLLVKAELPVCFADKVGRSAEAVRSLVELAELLAMPVINLGHWHSFPCPHPLDFAGAEKELVAEADAVLAMEVVDLAGALRSAGAGDGRGPAVIGVSMDELLQHSLTTDYQGLPAVDLSILSSSASALPLLIEECRRLIDGSARERIDRRRQALQARQAELRARQRRYLEEQWDHPQISEARLVAELWQVIQKEDFVFTQGRVRRMAPGVCYLSGPECVVAGGGGGAVGSGPGVALGAALALKGTGKVPVAVMGDGEFLSSIQALWTGAHYRIPSLWVINNNRSYFNDEDHQDRVARRRNRPPENRWIAMRVEGPEIDFAAAVRPFGVVGEGPVKRAEDLGPALRRALDAVKQGQLAVVDVRTENRTHG